jgi:hypothetical protein
MTATELLLDQAARIREGIADLLERSSMTQMTRDWGSAVWLGPTGEWGKLDVEGHRIQSRVLEEYGRFFETLRVVLKGLPPDGLQQLEESDEAIRKVVEQSELTWLRSVDAARTSALSALETQCELLDRLHDAGGGAAIFVPDTNALLYKRRPRAVGLHRLRPFRARAWSVHPCRVGRTQGQPSKPRRPHEGGGPHLTDQGLSRAGAADPGRPAPQADELDQGDRYGAAVGRVACVAGPREPRRSLHRDGH